LTLPTGAILRKSNDVDYSAYSIGFGKKRNRVWMSGIFGPNASSGRVPENLLSSSVEIRQRTWKRGEFEGIDAQGRLRNGNYWRYFGQFGEEISYEDVPHEAARYFDGLINAVCFREWRNLTTQQNNFSHRTR